MNKSLFLFFIFLTNAIVFFAQDDNIKFGKVSEDELNMKFYDKDSTANALIMFDKGYSYFIYDNDKERFKLMFEKQIKIKFFKKEGFEYADFRIPLYQSKDGRLKENLIFEKGVTYNLENDKIVKLKVEKSDIILEETSENWNQAKFTFPGVKEGSIIELKYTIESFFYFNMQEWQFQYEIPVQYSNYIVSIPEFFIYHKNMRGYDLVDVKEEYSNRNETFLIDYKTPPKQGGVIEKGTIELPSISTLYNWTAYDIPSFISEAYITTKEDYLSILEFELSTIQFPKQIAEVYTSDWNAVNKQLLESDAFGRQLKISEFIQKTADEISAGITDKTEIMNKIYSYVQKNIKWDSYKTKYIDVPFGYTYLGQNSKSLLEKVILNKSGNSADINLLLLMLLKSKQINCNPVILSTRDNGKIFPTHPTLSRFNYVIVEALIGDKLYYLDATSDILPFGMLPVKCLNGTGRRVFSGTLDEVKIEPQGDFNQTTIYSLNIDTEEGLKGTVSTIYKGYAALDIRNDIINAGGVDPYKKEQIDHNSIKNIQDYTIEGFSEINDPLKENFVISTDDDITYAGDLIYLTPLLDEKIIENPFKLEERKYPVDFGFKISEKYIMQYTLPEGYEVIEFPENVSLALPDKVGSYQYQVSTTGNIIQIISHMKINQPVIQYDLYPALKNFYNLVREKQNQKIIIKKKL